MHDAKRVPCLAASVLVFVTMWPLAAGAVCPSPERVNTILRFQDAKEQIRGLRTDLSMADGECGRRRLTERIEAVSLGGRWLPKTELAAMIQRASERLGGAPPDSLR